jgi:sporulation protein YlmC with PRC-barrel domain
MTDYMNKPLISVTNGRRVGEIKDLYLDPQTHQVAAVLIAREGLINRKVTLVYRSAIQVYGEDAWLLNTADDVTETLEEAPADWLQVSELRGREVSTDGGTKLGSVGDVVLDDNGSLAALTLGRVWVQGPLAETRRIPIQALLRIGERGQSVIVDLSRAETEAMPAAPQAPVHSDNSH